MFPQPACFCTLIYFLKSKSVCVKAALANLTWRWVLNYMAVVCVGVCVCVLFALQRSNINMRCDLWDGADGRRPCELVVLRVFKVNRSVRFNLVF